MSMEISRVNTADLYTKAAEKKQVEENKKTPEEKKDGEKLIVAGLTLAGVAAMAALAIKKGKGKKGLEEAAQHAKKAAADIAHNEAGIKAAKEAAETAGKALSEGGVYSKVKEEATKNLTHDGKKVVKETLKNFQNQARAAEKAVQAEGTAAIETAQAGSKIIKGISQGMKNASGEKAKMVVDVAKDVAQQADDAAAVAKKIAENAPTRKNIQRATHAANQAAAAKNALAHTEKRAAERTAEIAQQEATKAVNLAKMQATPGYQAGLAKQAANAEAVHAAKVQRELKRAMQTPAWANAMKSLNGKSPEQLQAVINSPKSSNMLKKVAQYLLG